MQPALTRSHCANQRLYNSTHAPYHAKSPKVIKTGKHSIFQESAKGHATCLVIMQNTLSSALPRNQTVGRSELHVAWSALQPVVSEWRFSVLEVIRIMRNGA